MRTRLKTWLVVGLLLGTALYAIAEEITLTTYYPSPRGVYQELKTAGDMVVGDITNPPGARLHVVQEGTAPALRIDDAPSDTSPLLVDATGNVGIGTAAPGSKLTVTGTIESSAGGVMFPDSTTQTTASPWAASATDIYNTNTGNVGIGTESPGYNLDVAGNAAANDVWLKSVGKWASEIPGGLTGTYATERWCDGLTYNIMRRDFTFEGGILTAVNVVIEVPGGCAPPVPQYCVVAGTPVRMGNGALKPIEQLKPGDIVLGYSAATQRVEPTAVIEKLQHRADHHPTVVVLAAGERELSLTAEHRIMTTTGWKRADALAVGDAVYVANSNVLNEVAVTSATHINSAAPLYTIRTGTDNYFASDLLIHTE